MTSLTPQEEENLANRRRSSDSVENYFKSNTKEIDPETGRNVIKIFAGGWHVSGASDNEMLSTILGSCISACIRDPMLRVGGMNHFLLPGDDTMNAHAYDAARYGVFAMETLINEILKFGGRKNRLEVKVFGGGNVTSHSSKIGTKNANFVRHFLGEEGIKIVSEDLEGDLPRRVHYYPDTGKVMIRKLRRKEDMAVVAEEARYSKSITSKPVEGDIDLF